jgi:hypothetical protein
MRTVSRWRTCPAIQASGVTARLLADDLSGRVRDATGAGARGYRPPACVPVPRQKSRREPASDRGDESHGSGNGGSGRSWCFCSRPLCSCSGPWLTEQAARTTASCIGCFSAWAEAGPRSPSRAQRPSSHCVPSDSGRTRTCHPRLRSRTRAESWGVQRVPVRPRLSELRRVRSKGGGGQIPSHPALGCRVRARMWTGCGRRLRL